MKYDLVEFIQSLFRLVLKIVIQFGLWYVFDKTRADVWFENIAAFNFWL